MPEFLALVESLRAEEASIQNLFGKEEVGARANSLHAKADYTKRLAEAATFVSEVLQGKRPAYQLREAMSTSDFSYLFADILDRQVLASYRETPSTFRQWARVKTVPDFRTVKRLYSNGGDGTLNGIKQLDEYRQVSVSDGKYEYAVNKYGAAFDISWEALINDDLDLLHDMPARFGRAARRTEEKTATALIANNASFYTTGQGNRRTSAGGQLQISSLAAGLQAMAAMKDAGGEPIWNTPSILMVPPALEITALNILNSLEIDYKGDGTIVDIYKVNNWIKSKLTLVVNYYLPIIDTSKGDTGWYLFADPNEGRGAVEVGFLRGHEEPEVFMKAPDAVRIGGGVDQMAGSFYHDSIEYKVRHVIGGATLDYRYSYFSEGNST